MVSRRSAPRRPRLSLPALIAALALAASPSAAAAEAAPGGVSVYRVFVTERSLITELDREVDVWAVEPEGGYLLAALGGEEVLRLRGRALAVELDAEQTGYLRAFERAAAAGPTEGGGIPGFPCYRTVEETHATAFALAASHPQLATVIDIGDSWEKTQNAAAGYDMLVLRLTNAAVAGDKPSLYVFGGIHAREYVTPETATRFAEHLVTNYGVDPDVTLILDHHQVHLVLQTNPDGRKMAETGLSWRKNADNDHCANTNTRGVDLNRNFEFEWGCCNGSSTNPCSLVFRGPAGGSEPESAAVMAYGRSIFPDQRPNDLVTPAPLDSTGIQLDLHSFGGDVLWSWSFMTTPPPNDIYPLGRKYAFYTGYRPQHGALSNIDGATKDFSYGELGVPGFTIELGTTFFEPCSNFESTIFPDNLQALLYAAKAVRAPYLTPRGPDAVAPAAGSGTAAVGQQVPVTAVLDDTRYGTANGIHPSQAIAAGEVYVDVPPWSTSPVPVPLAMSAADGTFDATVEAAEAVLDTSGLAPGRHLLFVRGQDADGDWGAVSAVFLDLFEPLFSDGFETGGTSQWTTGEP